ncbi:MAG: ATP-binding protein [Gammaproteobacteria bacterium]|nr:MAG: ATP-binding protein [Gammaproteobacteria bacterium]RLA60520.1 MAG: ATP-binding protein [Gammaproteobacteria bacterium]
MRIELNNSLDEIVTAMTALRAYADSVAVDEAARQAAALVLDELLTNIISYGLKGSQHDPIILELDIADKNLQIRITDGGIPFNPFDQPDPNLDLPLEQRQPGGLGIYLVKKYMDEYSYRYSDQQNIVTLRKKLAPAPDQAGKGQ